VFLVSERDEQTVGDEFDVLAHEGRVHADEAERQSKLLLNINSLHNDPLHRIVMRSPPQVLVNRTLL